jgi:tRNA G18 (ribose-2'-O)-methylase SpoU
MTKQHSHSTSPFEPKSFPITILCDHLTSPANIGALFRIADAFGVSSIILTTSDINFTSNRLLLTARGTLSKVNYKLTDDLLAEIRLLKQREYLILALEISNDSIPLHSLSIQGCKRIALLIGNERHGISDTALELADQIIHIPMYGQNSSMNVIQATGIALYSLTNDLN